MNNWSFPWYQKVVQQLKCGTVLTTLKPGANRANKLVNIAAHMLVRFAICVVQTNKTFGQHSIDLSKIDVLVRLPMYYNMLAEHFQYSVVIPETLKCCGTDLNWRFELGQDFFFVVNQQLIPLRPCLLKIIFRWRQQHKNIWDVVLWWYGKPYLLTCWPIFSMVCARLEDKRLRTGKAAPWIEVVESWPQCNVFVRALRSIGGSIKRILISPPQSGPWTSGLAGLPLSTVLPGTVCLHSQHLELQKTSRFHIWSEFRKKRRLKRSVDGTESFFARKRAIIVVNASQGFWSKGFWQLYSLRQSAACAPRLIF